MQGIIEFLDKVNWPQMTEAFLTTLIISLIVTFAALIIGLILGITMHITGKDGLFPNRPLYLIQSVIVNILRAVPFMILIIVLLPFTKIITGTIVGPVAALPALIISATPFYARMVLMALQEVDGGVVEAAQAMGAKPRQIIFKVLIPESLPALLSGITITAISIVGLSTVAGAIGAGGLGNIAYIAGFQTNNNAITVVATILSLVIVFAFQFIGEHISKAVDKR
ncbi:ABC transporter permease [Culicoidibacter larvae]|uniref:ABC transporter permease n=1 Tax=Culicoidibacter larvae TaxID=2579976 RepID=A0A5R8QB89_9FIRM|nr:methionine ABC transporter permease [Culicoidibacter larvae]TLG73795.1 ABC transporter permease [Culicoidibacter larvae]